jgi:hypothetical protein
MNARRKESGVSASVKLRKSAPYREGRGGRCEAPFEIFPGTVPGEAKRLQIPLSEPKGRVWDLQCSEPQDGREKVACDE